MRRGWKILLAAFVLVPLLSLETLAGDAGRESQFSIGSGVRAVGMGGGFTGMADDASAIFWNQAGLALLDRQEFNFMHATLFEGSTYDVATYVYPHPKFGGFGISLMRLGTGDIIRRVEWNEDGEFGYYIAELILGYGRKLEGGFYAGIALKIVNQSLDNNSAYGAGLDLSFYKSIHEKITAGILFQDIIPPRLQLAAVQETAPHNVMAGIGIKDIGLFKNLKHNFNLGFEKLEDRSTKLHAGIESVYSDWFDLRAGYDRDNLTFGLGLYLKGVRFDYAYRIMDGITDSHRFGFSFRFGMSVSEKIRREADLESARGSYLILDERNRQFEHYKSLADSLYGSDNLDSAFVYYHRALAYREGDPEVLRKIESVNEARLELMRREKIELAQEELNQLIISDYYVYATQLYEQGQLKPSLGLAEYALGIDSTDQRFLLLKDKINNSLEATIIDLLKQADVAEKEGRLSDAVRYYAEILDIAPQDITVRQLMGRVGKEIKRARLISSGVESFYLGRLTAAERDFNEVLKLFPGNIIANEYLGKIISLKEQLTGQAELEKDEKVWKIYLNALEYYQSGNYRRAIELWEEVLKYYPGNEQTLNNIKQAKLRLQSEE